MILALAHWTDELLAVVARAGAAILAVREAGVEVDRKCDDSPVTRADFDAEKIILEGLQRIAPGLPVISEESGIPPWAARNRWQTVWLVDPLDGTREFVAGRDEFTVNIALVEDGLPVLGLIYHPATREAVAAFREASVPRGWACFSCTGGGYRNDLASPQKTAAPTEVLRVAVSRHYDGDIAAVPAQLQRQFSHTEVLRTGSALKFNLLATGRADFYVRKSPTHEWDTAAGQAILEGVGGGVCDFAGRPLVYNRRESTLNPGFYAFGPGVAALDWL